MAIIDCQWHWYPREFCEAQLARRSHPLWRREGDDYVFDASPTQGWRFDRRFTDLDTQFEIMDEAGIDMVLASPVVVGDVSALEPSEGRAACEMLNEIFATAQREHPERFRALAVLPLQDVGASLELLDDAIGRLGLHGVLLHSNVAGASIADERLWPLYARAQELRVPLFLHPTHAFDEPRVRDHLLEAPFCYMFDTTIAAMSLIVGGVLDRFPDLTLVHPHLGATLPYLIDRADVYRRQGRWKHVDRPLREYLRRFHTDTVSDSPGALRMALELYGADRVLFSTDHPYFPAGREVAFVREHLDPALHRDVFELNARRLLGLPERKDQNA